VHPAQRRAEASCFGLPVQAGLNGSLPFGLCSALQPGGLEVLTVVPRGCLQTFSHSSCRPAFSTRAFPRQPGHPSCPRLVSTANMFAKYGVLVNGFVGFSFEGRGCSPCMKAGASAATILVKGSLSVASRGVKPWATRSISRPLMLTRFGRH